MIRCCDDNTGFSIHLSGSSVLVAVVRAAGVSAKEEAERCQAVAANQTLSKVKLLRS